MQIDSTRVIVITGASSGAGKAMALALSAFRPRLIIAARRKEALEATAAECREKGAEVTVVVADTTVPDDLRNLAEEAQRATGKIDVWINNAGVLAAGALEDVPDSINEGVIKTNLLGYIRGAQVAISYFKRQREGILINNISIGGWLPAPYATAYTASKFGLRGFSAALKGELSNFPAIHIVDLVPAFIDTPGIDHAANYTGKEIQAIPPVWDPQAVARAVVRAIERPRSIIRIGIPATLLQVTYALLPRLTRNIAGAVIRKYLKQAKPAAETSGNVLGATEFGTGIYGGPAAHPGQLSRTSKITMAGAFVVGLVLAMRK